MNIFLVLFFISTFDSGIEFPVADGTGVPTFKFELPLDLTYNLDISWNHKFIAYYKLKDGVVVDLEVKFFSSFQDYLLQLTFSAESRKGLKSAETASKSSQGLVPEIDLPIAFPSPVAGIIGQGGKLDVSGSQRIEFGGSKAQNLDLIKDELTPKESWLPSPEMEQHLRVNLKGTIGEKINVFIDHDSEREFDLNNTLKLEYKGDEDEIVQSVKAGNTELSLAGISLIGGSTSHKGLFGIKTEAKIGPVNLTAIASREEAENQSRDWKGGGITQRELTIDDRDFARARFFIIAPPKYINSLADPHNIYSGNPYLLPKKILSFQLYLDIEGSSDEGGNYGKTFDVPNEYYQDSVIIEDGYFVEEFENEYFVLDTTGIDSFRFAVLELFSSLSSGDLLASRWKYMDHNGDTITIGKAESDSLKDLQTIKRWRRNGAEDTSYVSWWFELKNIYSIGGADISKINIKVFKYNYGSGEDFELVPDTNITYRELLGLYTSNGRLTENVLDTTRGIILFPSSYPFLSSSLGMEPDSIYNVPKFSSDVKPKYYIWIQYEGVQTEYQLGMLNIIPGSETVLINTEKMEKGRDYNIDYDRGTIKFLTPLAEDPGADIKVNFQYVPIFQATAKNLIGTRAESKIGKLGQVSSAFLYYSTSSMDFRPRLGTEPRKIVLGEIAANITTNPEFLTLLIDHLPLVETNAPSSFSIQGNAGFSIPNPNTKGEVYIDDMEGAKSSTSLGILRSRWHYGSVPPAKQTDKFAQIQWFNPPDGIPAFKLYPQLPEHKRNEKRTVLLLALPSKDNWRFPSSATTYWTTLLTCVSTRGMDFSENEFLEVWVNGNNGVLHLDIGTNISEDHIRRDGRGDVKEPNGLLDTEDKDGNGELGPDEDVGIDGVKGDDENKESGDDWNDDYDASSQDDYSKINGTEGNSALDGEDLDLNKILNVQSDYFSFEIDLENDEPTIDNNNGWRLFRIPLNENKEVGTSSWECIKYARLWIEGLSKDEKIEIAALDIVGNKWKHSGSKSVKISVKNTDENPNEYTSPPGIELERDAYGRTEREQSLALIYNGLLDEEGSCYTIYTLPRNFIQYKSLKVWVKGTGESQFFMRIGGDELNYYEYRKAIPGNWEELEMLLETASEVKAQKSDMDTGIFVSGNWRIYGSPSFTKVGRLEFGVVNDSLIPGGTSGEIWIDELRLTDVRREVGIAGNISSSMKFADVADFSVSYKAHDQHFKSLGTFMSSGEAIGTNEEHSLSLRSNLSLNKFLPNEWRMSIPLNMGISRTKSIPKYQSNSDIILAPAQSSHQTSNTLKRDCGVSFSKSGSKNPLLKYTLDNIKGRASYGDNSSFAYTKIDSSQTYSGSVSYGISPPLPPIKIKKLELRYYPQQINLSGGYSYSWPKSYRMTVTVDTVFQDTAQDTIFLSVDTSYVNTNPVRPVRGISRSSGFSYSPVNPLKFNYSLSMTNDLNIGRSDPKTNELDTETGREERVGVSFSPSFGFISPSANYSTSYHEDHRETLDSLREVSNSNSISFGLPVNLAKTLGFLTHLRDESLDSTATMGTPHWILMWLENISKKFHMPQLSHSISRSSRFYKVIVRPPYEYRWGIWDEPTQRSSDSRNSSAITKSYGITRLGLGIGNFSISGGATHSVSNSASGNSSKKQCSENTEFPRLSLSVSGLEKLAFLRNWFNSFTVSSHYTISWKNSGYVGEDFNKVSRDMNYGFDLRPQWKQGISTVLSTSFTNGRNETKGDYPKVLLENHADFSTQVSYTFRAPTGLKIPFLSHIKWTGNLDASLTAKYSTACKENITDERKEQDSRSFSITPQGSYNFSSSITGGFNGSYTRYWNRIGTGNTRNVVLRFFAEFSF